jgi:hypothetical protein
MGIHGSEIVVVHTSAFGVGSVWMNIVRRAMVADGATIF